MGADRCMHGRNILTSSVEWDEENGAEVRMRLQLYRPERFRLWARKRGWTERATRDERSDLFDRTGVAWVLRTPHTDNLDKISEYRKKHQNN